MRGVFLDLLELVSFTEIARQFTLLVGAFEPGPPLLRSLPPSKIHAGRRAVSLWQRYYKERRTALTVIVETPSGATLARPGLVWASGKGALNGSNVLRFC